ncbi:MAG: HDOD domain-containing protein [Candidatus Omnitrophica bacterium]|nr:HDOD domain-containing protein [Candidatus Omnitrophota bacterium]
MKRSLQAESLHHRIAALENLPTLPAVAVELIRRWNEPDLSIRSITDILSRDPSLAAKVIQVANSPTFGLKKQVTSLNHAAALLGMNALRCVTLGVTVFQSFSDHRSEWMERLDVDEFWRHSLAVAVAAEMLAVRFGWASPEEAFLAGLLHDIGKIGLLSTDPERYVQVVGQAAPGDRALVEYEADALSVTHTEVGKWIAERWGFPELFRDAVWLHHQPPGPGPILPGQIGKLVYLADHVARRARIGEAGNRAFGHDDHWLSDRFGLAGDELDSFTGELLIRVQALGEQLELPIPTVQVYLKALEEANRSLSRTGLTGQRELAASMRTGDILRTLSEIARLPVQEELEVDLLAHALDLIRERFELPWMVILTHDPILSTIEGVIFRKGMQRPRTFYQSFEGAEVGAITKNGGRKVFLDLLGDTVLSDGQRVNLREEVLQVLGSGQLMAIPLELGGNYRGECFVDTSNSKVVDSETRASLESAIEAAATLQDRARLYHDLRREAEAALQAARRESEALRQLFHIERLASVGRLAAGAAHEINNPLAVISGKAQLLLMDEKEPKRLKTLNDIVEQSERISKIIRDLMGFARPTHPSVTDVELAPLIENTLQMARHRLPKARTLFEVDIPEDLPTLRVDAKQVEQVLVNLVVNAIQAMGGEGKVTLRAARIDTSGMIGIQVEDTGPGIPSADLQKIFDPFFTTKREGEGTGLGLAVSQRIIETHGGNIRVSSHLGKGTAFFIQLPSGQGEEQPSPTRLKEALAARKPAKKRLLLVDDEAQLSDLIRDYLLSAGYVIDQAIDGVEALELMSTRNYDALVMDIRMPRKDGLEVLEELQETTPGIPTLIITGLATHEELEQAIQFGANKVLRKPFQLDELLSSIREITQQG